MSDARLQFNAANQAQPTRPSHVHIVEVGPRDGLQNEPVVMPTEDKIRFVELLSDSGLKHIEVSSFVSPKRVPQLADAELVFARLPRHSGIRYTALVPNERGLDRALNAHVDGIALFTAASETFTTRNIGMTILESLELFRRLSATARSNGLWLRAYVSTAFDCPFEGPTAPEAVAAIVLELLDMGVEEISIGDTIGSAKREDVARLTEALLPVLPLEQFAYHFHDTSGNALENVAAALHYGVATFDAATGGMGGCPFAPGAPGNLATEKLVSWLAQQGIHTGVDLERLQAAASLAREFVARGRAISAQ